MSVQTEDGWGMFIARTPTAESPSHAQDYCEALIILIGAMHSIIRICMSGWYLSHWENILLRMLTTSIK